MALCLFWREELGHMSCICLQIKIRLWITEENIDVSKIRQLQTHYSLDSSLEFVSRSAAVPAEVSCRRKAEQLPVLPCWKLVCVMCNLRASKSIPAFSQQSRTCRILVPTASALTRVSSWYGLSDPVKICGLQAMISHVSMPSLALPWYTSEFLVSFFSLPFSAWSLGSSSHVRVLALFWDAFSMAEFFVPIIPFAFVVLLLLISEHTILLYELWSVWGEEILHRGDRRCCSRRWRHCWPKSQ